MAKDLIYRDSGAIGPVSEKNASEATSKLVETLGKTASELVTAQLRLTSLKFSTELMNMASKASVENVNNPDGFKKSFMVGMEEIYRANPKFRKLPNVQQFVDQTLSREIISMTQHMAWAMSQQTEEQISKRFTSSVPNHSKNAFLYCSSEPAIAALGRRNIEIDWADDLKSFSLRDATGKQFVSKTTVDSKMAVLNNEFAKNVIDFRFGNLKTTEEADAVWKEFLASEVKQPYVSYSITEAWDYVANELFDAPIDLSDRKGELFKYAKSRYKIAKETLNRFYTQNNEATVMELLARRGEPVQDEIVLTQLSVDNWMANNPDVLNDPEKLVGVSKSFGRLPSQVVKFISSAYYSRDPASIKKANTYLSALEQNDALSLFYEQTADKPELFFAPMRLYDAVGTNEVTEAMLSSGLGEQEAAPDLVVSDEDFSRAINQANAILRESYQIFDEDFPGVELRQFGWDYSASLDNLSDGFLRAKYNEFLKQSGGNASLADKAFSAYVSSNFKPSFYSAVGFGGVSRYPLEQYISYSSVTRKHRVVFGSPAMQDSSSWSVYMNQAANGRFLSMRDSGIIPEGAELIGYHLVDWDFTEDYARRLELLGRKGLRSFTDEDGDEIYTPDYMLVFTYRVGDEQAEVMAGRFNPSKAVGASKAPGYELVPPKRSRFKRLPFERGSRTMDVRRVKGEPND